MVETNGTVWVGFTLGDAVAGIICIGFDILKDVAEGKAFGAVFGSKFFKGITKKVFTGLYRRLRPPKMNLSGLVPGTHGGVGAARKQGV